jgi:hypothetical protein
MAPWPRAGEASRVNGPVLSSAAILLLQLLPQSPLRTIPRKLIATRRQLANFVRPARTPATPSVHSSAEGVILRHSPMINGAANQDAQRLAGLGLQSKLC